MPSTGVYLNNLDLASLDLEVEDIDGLADVAATRLPELDLPGLAGRVVTSALGSADPREITLQVAVVVGQRVTTAAHARDRMRRLAALAGSGLVELRTVQEPAVTYAGFLASLVEQKVTDHGRLTVPTIRAVLRFRCPDPYGFDAGVVQPFGATPERLWLGTAPSKPVLYMQGPATNPSVVYRTAPGAARCTMGFSVTLAAGDWLRVDCDQATIRKSVSGSESDGLATWTTAADGFMLFDPGDGDTVGGLAATLAEQSPGWPSVEVSGLTSGGSAEAIYRRQFR